MKIIRSVEKLKSTISNVSKLGFVPTMGSLHLGHLSLVKKSINKSRKTLVSIYINPTQFNNKKDFKMYPKTTNKDLKILRNKKVDFVFLPKTKEIYKKKRNKILKLPKEKNLLCGKFRKKHFEGVVDIVDRLLEIINPKFLFLGEKDFQQLFLIKKYIKGKFKVKIIPCKTVRNKNLVALSSRNKLLNKKNIYKAGQIAKKLKIFKYRVKKDFNYKKKLNEFKIFLMKKYQIKIDYLELRNENDLKKIKNYKKFRLFIAYYINKVRLIDNF